MNFIAWKMLTGDRAKYLGLIFAIAFCTFLLENQTSIFASILKRTGSQILDVTDADVWVMDAKTEYFEQTKRSEEHTSELQSLTNLVCRLLLENKNSAH